MGGDATAASGSDMRARADGARDVKQSGNAQRNEDEHKVDGGQGDEVIINPSRVGSHRYLSELQIKMFTSRVWAAKSTLLIM